MITLLTWYKHVCILECIDSFDKLCDLIINVIVYLPVPMYLCLEW